ncbi:MAG: hypothetical protein LVQ96_05525 [Thermoplasmatales archaeon]|nr:hypothetical protein [Thermoplasmatales archaeon]MCW6170612.1 hypothetical protein [Thermoplasmatales archaeon]
MEENKSSVYTDAAKNWISSQTGIQTSSMNVFRFEKSGENYNIGIETYSSGHTVKYVVVVGSAGNVISHKELKSVPEGGSAGTLLTLAFVFSIIFEVIFIVEFILGIVAYTAAVSAAAAAGVALAFAGILLIAPIIYIIFFVIGIYCLIRIMHIRNWYNSGEYQKAYDSNSVLFGVLALLFNGFISGLLMLIARGSMKPSDN